MKNGRRYFALEILAQFLQTIQNSEFWQYFEASRKWKNLQKFKTSLENNPKAKTSLAVEKRQNWENGKYRKQNNGKIGFETGCFY